MILRKNAVFLFLIGMMLFTNIGPVFSAEKKSLLMVTPVVLNYADKAVAPLLYSQPSRDKLSLLLRVSKILIDEESGIHVNRIEPNDFFIYDKLDKFGLGGVYALKLSSEQELILKRWHSKYMNGNPADLFFGPSADEIIRSKAAFGCTHYARAFMAVVKALGLVEKPQDLRYVVSSKADDYNKAMENNDFEMTINGHQFVLVKMDSRWLAINTSKSDYFEMPVDFSPESCMPPKNISVRFESYPGIVFLLRKIGKDYDDDCGDDSLSALMNISRSGRSDEKKFLWEKYVFEN